MSYKIRWSKPAFRDLENLVRYIAEDQPEAAERVGMAIYNRISILSDHPKSGRLVPELNDLNYRELIHAPFRIIYKIDLSAQRIEIIRIWHSSRGTPEV